MIDRTHDLPITKQAEVLNISRGSVYYLPRPVLTLERSKDRLSLVYPLDLAPLTTLRSISRLGHSG